METRRSCGSTFRRKTESVSSPAVSDPANYLDRLAAWAATTPLDALPPAVRERACVVIADSLGVTAHGMQTGEMREFVGRLLGEGRPGRASVIGAGRRTDPPTAALLNGTAGTWIDMNEGNLYANGH